jgi:DNA modification methylase
MRTEVIGDATLYCSDCLEILPTLGRVDAVITDPPFGIKRDRGMGGGGGGFYPVRFFSTYGGDWDRDRPSPDVFDAILSASDAHIIWGGQFFADLLPPQGKWLWWDKCQTMPSYGDGELAWTSLSGDAPKKFVYSNNGLMAREKDRVHPTQKPVALMQWCLGFVPTAKTICDPFMGSGTTGVAALQLGRKFIGIEIDPGYFDIACKRISEAWKQPRLFEEPKRKPQPAPNFFDGAAQ